MSSSGRPPARGSWAVADLPQPWPGGAALKANSEPPASSPPGATGLSGAPRPSRPRLSRQPRSPGRRPHRGLCHRLQTLPRPPALPGRAAMAWPPTPGPHPGHPCGGKPPRPPRPSVRPVPAHLPGPLRPALQTTRQALFSAQVDLVAAHVHVHRPAARCRRPARRGLTNTNRIESMISIARDRPGT
jgi:hypothetical protein